MKKTLIMVVIGIMVLGTLSGCSKKSNEMTIGVSIANFDDTFLTYMMDGMKEYAEQLQEQGIELKVEYTDAKEDIARQMNQIENFVVQQKDAIVVVPVDTSASGPITKAALEAGIPIVYVNRNPGNLPEGAYYVGSEEIKAGIMQMEFLAEKLGGNGKIVILMGKLDNEGALKRTEGVEQIAAKYDGIEIVDKQTGLWQRNEGMMKTEDWLNRFGDELKAIAANNDDMALGAIQALKDSGREDVIVIGVDATPDGLNALKNGDLAATVFQDALGQGGGAIELAYEAAKGEKPEQERWIPFKLVTPENLNEFLK